MNFKAFSEMAFIKIITMRPSPISLKNIPRNRTPHRGGKIKAKLNTNRVCQRGNQMKGKLDSCVACHSHTSLPCPHHPTTDPASRARLLAREHLCLTGKKRGGGRTHRCKPLSPPPHTITLGDAPAQTHKIQYHLLCVPSNWPKFRRALFPDPYGRALSHATATAHDNM